MDKGTKALAQRVAALEKAIHRLTSAPREQNQESVTQEHHPNQESIDAPRTGSIIPPPPSNPDEPEHKRNTTVPWWKRVGGLPWKKILEVVGIFAGIGYAWVTYLQWRDLRHNFEVDQRAWLKVEWAFPDTISEGSEAVSEQVVNIGKSVALKILPIDTMFEIVDSDKPPSFVAGPYHNLTLIDIMFPGDKQQFFVTRTPRNTDGSPRKLTPPEIHSLMVGDTYIAIFGQIAYEDQFGRHWTRFCTWKYYAPGSRGFKAASCVAYNAVGDGNPPKN